MQKYLNEIAILALCCMCSILQLDSAFIVVGFLCAVTLVCLSIELPEWGGAAVILAFDVLSLLMLPIAAFIPLCAYISIHQSRWPIRLGWAVSLAFSFFLNTGQATFFAWLSMLCLISVLLAIKNVRFEHEFSGMRMAYDDLRGRLLEKISESSQEPEGEVSSNINGKGALDVKGDSDLADAAGPAEQIERAFSNLSNRELAVVNLIAEGMDNREIASELFLSEGTVRNLVSSILAKEKLSNRTQIAVAFFKRKYNA